MISLFLAASSLLLTSSNDFEQQAKSNAQPSDFVPNCSQSTGAAESGKLFVSLGGGYGWSQKANVRASSEDWDPSPEGYNSDVKQSEVYTAGLGYHFKTMVSILFEVAYRPSFKYSRFQTSSSTNTPGFLGAKTRHFCLSSLAFTFNAFINKEGSCFEWKWYDYLIAAPFFGAGLGVSYNDVYDFYSVLPASSGGIFDSIGSIENNKVHAAFAGQVLAGLACKVSKRFSLDAGYRWFYGGRFLSNSYCVDVFSGFSTPVSTTPWKGVLRANEVFLNLNYTL